VEEGKREREKGRKEWGLLVQRGRISSSRLLHLVGSVSPLLAISPFRVFLFAWTIFCYMRSVHVTLEFVELVTYDCESVTPGSSEAATSKL
jgi:hypothetical protein